MRRLPDVAVLAADDGEAEQRLHVARAPVGSLIAAAEALSLLERPFILGFANGGNGAAHPQVVVGVALLLAHPLGELGGIEMAIAVVHERRRRAVLELQVSGVRAFGVTRRVPDAGHTTHT